MPSTAQKEPVTLTSADPTAERIAALKSLFPDVFADGKIDLDRLRAALGDAVAAGPERFLFSWAGRSDAAALLQTPSRATLIPKPDESVNWDTTRNLFIEGDNLEVLKLLYKAYAGKVKLIYIDPPYNTGQDFVYPDDFTDPLAVYLKLTGQADESGKLLTSNPETSGRYHSAWLSMMYPRLFLARQLLRDDGVIFVSIDDHEVHHLRMLMNEVFGEENFVAHIVWQKRYVSNVTAKHLSDMHDHIIMFGRDAELVQLNRMERTEEQLADYKNPDNDPRGPWRAQDLSASKPYKAGEYTITTPAGLKVDPPPGRYWRCHREQYDEWVSDNRIWFGKEGTARPMLKAFLSEVQQGLTPNTWWSHDFAGHNKEATLEVKKLFDGASPFDTAKPVKLLRRILELASDPNSIVLDFFAGSATVAQAVLELNHDDGGDRRFVIVQLPEQTENQLYPTIAEIGKERIRKVITKLKQDTGNVLRGGQTSEKEDLGFKVFALGESHFEQWAGVPDRDPAKYADAMAAFLDPIKPDSDTTAVLWELAIKEGYGLNSTIAEAKVGANTIHTVTDPEKDPPQSFRVCLDEPIAEDIARQLELTASDLFICRDQALDDTLAANLALQCRLKTI